MSAAADVPDPAVAGTRVRDAVRAIVAEVAPEELPLVDGLRRFDDEAAVARLARGGNAREPLGFGLEEIVALVTPVVWIVLDEAVRKAVGDAVDGASGGLRKAWRKVTRRSSEPLSVPALTTEQIADVRRRVFEMAEKTGLDPERAEVLADRVVAQLALSATPERPDDGDAEERNAPDGS
ncbi:hypothetical protein ACH347_28175 [Saccharopolyspora sp. 5N102]|uniref:hypothetical protein n=1 Tax=Saccharopolyspora sp. 5N102 TaxID=3375155 RepID=UPI00379F127A